jgi:hypothetical protein
LIRLGEAAFRRRSLIALKGADLAHVLGDLDRDSHARFVLPESGQVHISKGEVDGERTGKIIAWALAADAPAEGSAQLLRWDALEKLEKMRGILADYEGDGQRRTAEEFVECVFLGLLTATTAS